MKQQIKYYCPFCKKTFTYYIKGHAGWNDCCAGGCNTSKAQMKKLNKKK